MKVIFFFSILFLSISFSLNATTYWVTNTNDSGTGSLRQAASQAHRHTDTIRFNPSLISNGSAYVYLNSSIEIGGCVLIGLYNSTDTLFISGDNSTNVFVVKDWAGSSTIRTMMDSVCIINADATTGLGAAVHYAGASSSAIIKKLIIKNSLFRNNTTSAHGGAINAVSSGVYGESLDLEIINSHFEFNTAGSDGGAIAFYCSPQSPSVYNIDIEGCTFYKNSARKGGAIDFDNYTFAGSSTPSTITNYTITNCTFNQNTTTHQGGAIAVNSRTSETYFDINISTIVNNSTGDKGGAIYATGDDSRALELIITNSTIVQNNAATTTSNTLDQGGGIYYDVDASSSNFVYNQRLRLVSTIVALNNEGNIYSRRQYSTFGGSSNPLSSSYSILVDAGLNLGALQDNGGITQTMLPMLGSTAIDMGNPSDFSAAQNGLVTDARRDVGAAEYQNIILAEHSIYVDLMAIGANNGTSWANAYTNLQEAIDSAVLNDTIFIAQGTYLPSKDKTGLSTNGRSATYFINKDIVLQGGYPTGGGIQNPMLNKTILSGDLGTLNDASDNAYHVLWLEDLSNAALVAGVYIQDANANGAAYPDERGAGIYNNGGNGENSSPSLQNCVIRWNTATVMGGGLLNFSNNNGTTSPILNGCLFYENSSTEGASIANSTYLGGTNNTVITNSTITGNVGASSIYNKHGNARITVQNSIVWETAGNPISNYGIETTVQYSLINRVGGLGPKMIDGGNNIYNTNPQFVDETNDDYSLKATSIAINKGANAFLLATYNNDLTGGNRVSGSIVDLGAIERIAVPNPIYVNHLATGGLNDGSSWVNAFTDLQDALTVALSGNEIWVAMGSYKATASTDRNSTFNFSDGVKVYGGFVGTETTLSQRNWATNPTILSGDIGTISDPSDNSYHVVTFTNVSNNTELNGLIIQDGNANAGAYPNDRGAGIYNDGANAGNSNPTIQNCIIRWNNAGTMGGGLLNFSNINGNTSPIIRGCLFYENSSANGASIANSTFRGGSNNSIITNSTFADNTGGASIYNKHGNATITIQNSIVWDDNTIYNYGNETTLQYSSIKGSSLPAGTADGGNNQLATDPLFVDAANDNYRLQGVSPAIGAGNNTYIVGTYTLDLAHNNREIGTTVEMGCYEDGASAARPDLVQNEGSITNNKASEEQQIIDLEEAMEASSFDQKVVAKMTVYPNPVQDIVHINLKDFNQELTVRLLTTTGQVLQQEQVQADAQTVLQLNMGALAKGMYLLNLQLEDGTVLNEKVVKF